MSQIFKIHSKNNKIFDYKGKPTILVCATEHYGAVMNRPFDYRAYLKDCYDKNQNYTRLFLLFRELQTHNNPISTCKPQSPDYISPFMRVGPELAFDGLAKFDLAQWNCEFFNRLHEFMTLAEKYQVIVEVVLFSCSYKQELFQLLPTCAQNNINGTEDINFNEHLTMKHKKLFSYQVRYVKKIVSELNKYPNFFFEICNEPLSFYPKLASEDDVDAWQDEIVKIIREIEKDLPNQHLIAAEDCWSWHNWEGDSPYVPTERSFHHMDIDIVNVHPLPNISYGQKTYDMGQFMSKKLHLEDYKAFCLDTYNEKKVLNIDEDNIASQFLDYDGWTVHRKRAWTAVFCGAHYDYIDFSIQNPCPTGSPMSQKYIRTWFMYLQQYIESMDIINGKPLVDCIKNIPSNTVVSVYGVKGSEYHIYIAENRDVFTKGYSSQINGDLILSLDKGRYVAYVYAPEFGQFSPGVEIEGGDNVTLMLPTFKHDIVVRIIAI